jgi:hypothetical protein
MASIRASNRKSRVILDDLPQEFDRHINQEVNMNDSLSELVKYKRKTLQKSANSNYASNSRSGLYAIEEEFKSILVKQPSQLVCI